MHIPLKKARIYMMWLWGILLFFSGIIFFCGYLDTFEIADIPFYIYILLVLLVLLVGAIGIVFRLRFWRCPFCGEPLPDGNKRLFYVGFCPSCGRELEIEENTP